MENIFSLVLVILTFFTGIFWIIQYLKLEKIKQYLINKINYKHFYSERKIIKNNIIGKFNKKINWIAMFASIFPTMLLIFIIRSFVFEPFRIPSSSMMPTLLIGDFILVEKFSYSIKNPITKKTLIKTNYPKRGELVVFKYPFNPSLNYIKRIIGLPGDRIIYDPINKKIKIKTRSKLLPITYGKVYVSNFIQNFNLTINNRLIKNFHKIKNNKIKKNIFLMKRRESLNDITYNILISPKRKDRLEMYYKQPGCHIAEWIVPKGKYFMMGDNRDNSSDSRYWGFVPEKNLIGKAVMICMSFNKQNITWPINLRLDRIGLIH